LKQFKSNNFDIFGIFHVLNFSKLQKSEYSDFRRAIPEIGGFGISLELLEFHCCIRPDAFEDKMFDSISELFAKTPFDQFYHLHLIPKIPKEIDRNFHA